MVIHRLVHLLPRECQARLPQLTRVGGPRRLGGGLTQKPWENSNLPGMLWVGDRNEERRRMVGYQSFEAYLEEKFPDSRRKAYYLMSIHDHLGQIPAPEIEDLGWSKALELGKVARSEGRRFDCVTWLHRAQESTKQELKEAVHKYFTREDYEPYEMIYFKQSVAGGGKGSLRGLADGGDGALAGVLPETGVRGFSGGEGRRVDAGGDLDGDSPPCASAAAGVSGRSCRPKRGQGSGDRQQMLTKVKRIKLGKQIYRRLMKQVLERDG